MKSSNISPLNIVVPILVIAFITLVAISIEFYEEEVPGRWSPQALQNPYLAAEQFLQKTGVTTSSSSSLSEFDALAKNGTLLITESSQIDNQKLLNQVLSYLENGGNVIAGVRLYGNQDNFLIDHFGLDIEIYDLEDDSEEEESLVDTMREYNRQIEEGKSLEDIADENQQDEILTTVEFEYPTENLEIGFNPDSVFIHDAFTSEGMGNSDKPEPTSWSNSSHGVHFVQFVVGDGLITLVNDSSIWSNYKIDQHDHAYLLWILSESNGSLTILRSVIRDSLFELIGRNAFELVLAVLLLSLAWCWRLGFRFGRIIDEDFQTSRAKGEHLLSMGRYLWHRKKSEFLLSSIRQRLQRRSNTVVAGYQKAEQDRQFELLASYCNLDVNSVKAAFQKSEFNENTFVETVKILKKVEQSL